MNFNKILITSLLIVFLSFIGCSDSGTNTVEMNEIKIGALLPLSGDYKNQGSEILAALNFAVEDINKQFESENKGTRIKLIYEDTETDPVVTKAKFSSFLSQDIRITIGPLTSGEVLGIKDEVNSSENILISPSSTLTSLAIPGDNIYRLVPDDSQMVEAVVDVMWDKGIRNLAMLYVDNSWGQSFVSLVSEKFKAKGGTYIGQVAYIGARESELKEYVNELSELVNPALSSVDPSTVAVQMISLDVGTFLLEFASADSILNGAKWFGCDGYVNTDELFNFTDAVKFANDVEFTSPIYGSPSTDKSELLINRISAVTNSTPDAYALLTYDALMVAAKTLDDAGADASLTQLKEKFAAVISNYNGITGNIVLNNAGDRENGSYFFWQVVPSGNSYKWEHVKTFNNGVINK